MNSVIIHEEIRVEVEIGANPSRYSIHHETDIVSVAKCSV